MCGICGIVNNEDEFRVKNALKKMNDKMVHRGPDDEGFYFCNSVGFAMKRLSIIDVSGGHQPVFNEDNTIVVISNGEIYNYQHLANELKEQGHKFKSKSDTEVLVHGYQEWGIERLLNNLNGIFAFAVFDIKNNVVFIARDNFGVKPLYYTEEGNSLFFSSELNSLVSGLQTKPDLNLSSLNYYFSFQFIPAPHTIFKNVYKLEPGHYLKYSDKKVSITTYWNLKCKPSKDNIEVSAQKVKSLLTQAVKSQLISDVPLGAFLSGGIDSSIIVGLMSQLSSKQVKTFSIVFNGDDNQFDESFYSRKVAKLFNTDHNEIIFDRSKIKQSLEDYILSIDEPIADMAAIPTFVLSKEARKTVSVVLTGEGSDEIFGGYEYYKRFLNAKNRSFLNKMVPADLKSNLKKFFKEQSLSCSGYPYVFNDRIKNKLLSTTDNSDCLNLEKQYLAELNECTRLQQAQYLDMKLWLVDNVLMKVDKMTMGNSLEARVPFLDKELAQYAFNLPDNFKIKDGEEKFILKKVFKDLLPDEISRRKKKGFGVPMGNWFKDELKDMVFDVLSESNVKKVGVCSYDTVKNIKYRHFDLGVNRGRQLFAMLVFHLWYAKVYS